MRSVAAAIAPIMISGAPLEQDELLEALEEVVGIVLPASQCKRCDRIGAGRASEPEIDAAGKQRLQHLEALGDHQRRVVRQHHAAGADPDALGRGGDRPDHDLRRAARDRGQIVVLGDPVAGVAQAVRQTGEIEAVADRRGTGGRRGHEREVEHREQHFCDLARPGGEGKPARCSRSGATSARRALLQVIR
ncbi:MAG TPA: hypothetical protein VHQ91_05535 [Geminicoccaceae bacterium]|nr:hypothetical protein [Geminicoccaceae bacterium]